MTTENSDIPYTVNKRKTHLEKKEAQKKKALNSKPNNNTAIITPAKIDWQSDDNGYIVPYSMQFDDVYYTVDNGLAESRYVYVEQNNLPQRFAEMHPFDTFTIGELGFGTGLNFFATWQVWKEMQQETIDTLQNNHLQKKHLHFISFEKFPLTKDDFEKSLQTWIQTEPQLAPFINEMIENYPTLVAGCHRINFYKDNLTLDLWFGDANDNLAKLSTPDLINTGKVNAWFLDGFAPSCNDSLWTEQVLTQMVRLSAINSTVATFSCAGVVKRGLKEVGFDIIKVKGFGRKHSMLTAKLTATEKNQAIHPQMIEEQSITNENTQENSSQKQATNTNLVAVIGAGVSGLMSAWALANRGISVILLDKIAPLAGASGNPRGLLSPKMTPLHHVDEHLHSIGYLYSSRLFRQMNAFNGQSSENQVLEPTGAMDLLIKSNIDTDKIRAYPQDFATVLTDKDAKLISGLHNQVLDDNQYLPQAGLVNPQALANVVLAHPLVTFEQANIVKIDEQKEQVVLTTENGKKEQADHAIICLAHESCQLDKRVFDFRKIRGQLSWFTPSKEQMNKLPKIPLKYGGYCASFLPVNGDDKESSVEVGTPHFLLGASFVRNDTDMKVRQAEHQQSLEKLLTAIPELTEVMAQEINNDSNDVGSWQGRVGIRSQTPDYHPAIGRLTDSHRIWTLSGMGAKGYAYAPICAELLADQLIGQIPPVSITMLEKLLPSRKRLQQPLE